MVFGGVFPRVLRPVFDAGAVAFVGAYDAIPSIVAAYGMRRLRSAYTGSILRVRRSSDNAEQDISYTAAGDLDTAAVASFIGGGSGYVRTWYDQSSNAYDASQTTAANQPLYVASGQNGRPVTQFDGGNDVLQTAVLPISGTSAFSFLATLAYLSDTGGTYKIPIWNGVDSTISGFGLVRKPGSTIVYPMWGSFTGEVSLGAIANGTYFLWVSIYNGTSHNAYKNAILAGAVAYSASDFTTGVLSLGILLPSYPAHVGISELIICNAALSDANRQAAEAAANNYWAVY